MFRVEPVFLFVFVMIHIKNINIIYYDYDGIR